MIGQLNSEDAATLVQQAAKVISDFYVAQLHRKMFVCLFASYIECLFVCFLVCLFVCWLVVFDVVSFLLVCL